MQRDLSSDIEFCLVIEVVLVFYVVWSRGRGARKWILMPVLAGSDVALGRIKVLQYLLHWDSAFESSKYLDFTWILA